MNRLVGLTLFAMALSAQVAAPLAFEVASVKLIADPPGFFNTSLQITPRGFNANFAALRQIAGVAYGIQRVRIEGGPGWMDSDLYTIAAKAENPDTSNGGNQIREMLRTLLAERFKLVAHRETKQLPVYSLGGVDCGSWGEGYGELVRSPGCWKSTSTLSKTSRLGTALCGHGNAG